MQKLNNENINIPENSNARFNGTVGLFDMERFHKLAKYYKGGKYLDLGAFDSIMPMLLAERPGTNITVVDFADEILEFMRPRFPKVKFITHDIRTKDGYHLPFEDNELDYVVAGEVIEHMEDPKAFVEELLRVTKKGGWVAISTPFEEIKRRDKIGGAFHLWSYDKEDMNLLLSNPEIELHREGQFDTMIAWKQKQ